jgi:cell division protease FtsH
MTEQNNPDNNRNDSNNRPTQGGKGPGGPQRPPQNFMSRGALGWILLASLAVLLLVLMNNNQNAAKAVSWDQFFQYAENKNFDKAVIVENEQFIGELKPETPGLDAKHQGPYRVSTPTNAALVQLQTKELMAVKQSIVVQNRDNILMPLLLSWGPVIILAFLIYFFVFRSIRNAGGGPGGMLGSFGRSRHKVTNKETSNVTLADVAGIEEAKDEVVEIIEFLKNPKKFQRLGGRVPRGVLLIGEPGCGKTLLARAVAGEAEVPFFSISGSDFVEMFVGVGASRVRDLFKQAKESSPCIIFLDEIDAVGRKRGSGFASGGHDEREQTLNAILVEMDGFDTNDQVIVMAATNRADVLDPALIRPGRFDRQIHVTLPDLRGRMEILKVHSKRVKMSPEVDLEKLARGTPMFSGADLAAIINEAAIHATLRSKDFVEQDDLEEARDKVKWGRSRKSHKHEEDEKRVIAYHEAGHAIIMLLDPNSDPLHKVTIIPRGQALGTTFMLPERDRNLRTKRYMLAMLRTTYGGRIAEEMFCGDISSGASGDIQQASHIARAMITHYGMSEKLGFLLYGMDESRNPWEQPDKLYSDETARTIDEEVRSLIDRTYAESKQILEDNRDKVERLAQALLTFETLNRDEVDRLMRGEELGKASIRDLLKNEANKTPPTKPARTDTGLDNGTPGNAIPTPA